MRLAGALVLLAAAVASSASTDVSVAPYVDAERRGAVGTVDGRAYAERRKPAGPDTPLTGATVVLLPRSEHFLARLEALKGGARDSPTAYRDAALSMRRAREDYERRLWEAGAADLVRAGMVDGDGGFRFDAVPAGRWLLFAMHGTPHDIHDDAHARARERGRFTLGPRLRGYSSVLVWLRELEVPAAGTERLELTDRNPWFSGVVEDRERDAGR